MPNKLKLFVITATNKRSKHTKYVNTYDDCAKLVSYLGDVNLFNTYESAEESMRKYCNNEAYEYTIEGISMGLKEMMTK